MSALHGGTERLSQRYVDHKRIVLQWENAFTKSMGRAPGRDDLRDAPESVRSSYVRYREIKKYLEHCVESVKSSPSKLAHLVKTPNKIFETRRSSARLSGRAESERKHGHEQPQRNGAEGSSELQLQESNITKPGLCFKKFFPSGAQTTTTSVKRSSLADKLFASASEFENAGEKSEVPNKSFSSAQSSDLKPRNQRHSKSATASETNKKFRANTRSLQLPFSISDSIKNPKNPRSSPEKTDPKSPSPSPPHVVQFNYGNEDEKRKSEEDDANELELTFASKKLRKSLKSIGSFHSSKKLSVDILATPNRKTSLRHVDPGWLRRCQDTSGSEDEEKKADSKRPPPPSMDESESELSPIDEQIDIDNDSNSNNLNSDEIPSIPTDFMDTLASISDLDQLPGLLLDNTAIDMDLDEDKEILNPEILIGEDEIRELLKEINSLSQSPVKVVPEPYSLLEAMNDGLISGSKAIPQPHSPRSPENKDSVVKKRPASPAPAEAETRGGRKFFKRSRNEIIQKKTYTVRSYKPPTPIKIKSKVSQLLKPHVPASVKIKAKAGISKASLGTKKVNSKPSQVVKVGRVTRSGRVTEPQAQALSELPESPSSSTSRVTRSTPQKLRPPQPLRSTAVNKSGKKEVKAMNTPRHPPPRNEVDTFDPVMEQGGGKAPKRRGKKPTDKEFLQKKVATGRLNDNYVRIDVNKKVFVRGRKKINVTKIKKLDWKRKNSIAASEAKIKLTKCRKCGDVGHYSKFCLKGYNTKDDEPDTTEASPFPTLQEAANMIWKKSSTDNTRTFVYPAQTSSSHNGEGQESPTMNIDIEDGANSPGQENCSVTASDASEEPAVESETILDDSVNLNQAFPHVRPVFSTPCDELNSDSKMADEVAELYQALKLFGHKDFRPGQQEAITRVLRGLSTLVILSTGSGKSLCYFLPAYLYAKHNPGVITLCISPLVSLMEDQVQSIPAFLNGACLHTNMTEKQRELVLDQVRNKKCNILLVSPEAVCGGVFGLLRNTNEFPPIAFACIDEVHCVSEWSHNFRPSYLKVCKILREKLNVQTILGLTATSTKHTSGSICELIQVDPSTVIRGEIVPRNLRLSVSRDRDRHDALLFLLNEDRFKNCDSIIIYCTRREECERVASFLRTNLQNSVRSNPLGESRQRISASCEAYHAGMSAARRKRVQNYFMAGNIRIVVATVAFGMGIDKSDIRAVIHYNMPKTFESYVQEIGRAGRDGLPAECHLFLDHAKGNDVSELKRHIYSNSVDRSTVRNLLSKVFKACQCERIAKIKGTGGEGHLPDKTCPGHEVSFSVEDTVQELDLPEENIETLLCYLELDTTRKWIDMQPKCYQTCTIQSYGGSKLLKSAANKCPPLAMAIAILKERKKFRDTDVHLRFNLVEIASSVGWNSAVVRRELKSLEWTGTEFDSNGQATKFRKSGILVEFSDLAYRMIAPGQLTDDELDSVLSFLHGRNLEQEQTQLYQLLRIYDAFDRVSVPSVGEISEAFDEEKSDHLKKVIFDYFGQNTITCPSSWKMDVTAADLEKEDCIRRDVEKFLHSHSDDEITGRNIAKIFQGISSPRYSASDWGRNKSFWRRYLDVDFHYLSRLASEEIIRYK